MQAETFAFFGIFVLLLYIFGEIGDKKVLGVFASLLLLVVGVVIYTDGIGFQQGATKISTDSSTATVSGNTTTTTITKNETTTPNYAQPAPLPYVPVSYAQLFGICFVLLSLYGMYWYGLNVLRQGFGR